MNFNALEQTERLLDQILQSGVNELDILQQFYTFKHGLPHIRLSASCTVANGTITKLEDIDADAMIVRAKEAVEQGRVMKFVPASGAATRMFKPILGVLAENTTLPLELIRSRAETQADYRFTLKFIDNLHHFAFFTVLQELALREGIELAQRTQPDFDFAPVLRLLTGEQGLNYAHLPKGLILFHTSPKPRTAFEEHIVEALDFTLAADGEARLHFTVSPEHHQAVQAHIETVQANYTSAERRLKIELSEQKQSTNTIAVTPENEPFLTEDGFHFRPAGHGALLENLNDLQGDIICIKNIDNVVPDRLKPDTYHYKNILCGLLISLQEQIFAYISDMEENNLGRAALEAIAAFGQAKFAWYYAKPVTDYTDHELRSILTTLLHRPMRVCGMVKNEGEPGGGPFVVDYRDGSRSLQIVESAQIDLTNPEQRSIFETSTHFNPVDIVCAVRNYRGEPFNLLHFRDNETGFISFKSSNGRELKALELPGLWNGSMAYWNTVFVEVPTSTFNPVKTINDLLRPEHQ